MHEEGVSSATVASATAHTAAAHTADRLLCSAICGRSRAVTFRTL